MIEPSIKCSAQPFKHVLSDIAPACGRRGVRKPTLQVPLGTSMDVTEQEQSMRALRKSEEELRQILDLTPQLIAVFGPRRERLFINRIALEYFGLTLDEWRDTAPGAVDHPDDSKRVRAI